MFVEDRLSDLFNCEDRIETYFHENPVPIPQNVDEDDAVDAYESIIHIAAQSHQHNAHSVESESILAVQLLSKHFNKFPHVQSNVIDVLLSLSRPSASNVVRIHTLRSLFQIGRLPSVATTQSMRENESGWRDRIHNFVKKELQTEKSMAMERHLKQIHAALTLARGDSRQIAQETAPVDQKPYTLRSLDSNHDANHDTKSQEERERVASSSSSTRWFISCPPAPYVFIGNLPLQTTSNELAAFLAQVEPSLSSTAVQIKQPPRGTLHYEGRSNGGRNTSGFAFVSLPTTHSAKEIIQFVAREPFRGRILNGNFARGPPCNTLLFVQMLPGREFKEEDGLPVEPYDFASEQGMPVWSELCSVLENIGPIKVVAPGKIRFDALEDAKVAIRKHHLVVEDIVLVPYYDPDEQFETDATRNPAVLLANRERKRQISEERTQSFALKSGRVVGEDCVRSEEGARDRGFQNGDRIRRENERTIPRNEYNSVHSSRTSQSPTRWHAKSALNESDERREKLRTQHSDPYRMDKAGHRKEPYNPNVHADRSQWHTHPNPAYRPREYPEDRAAEFPKTTRNRSSDRVSDSNQRQSNWSDRFQRTEPPPRRIDSYQRNPNPTPNSDSIHRQVPREPHHREPLLRGRNRSRSSARPVNAVPPRSRSRSTTQSVQLNRKYNDSELRREDTHRHPEASLYGNHDRRRIDSNRSIAEIAQSQQQRYQRSSFRDNTPRNLNRGNREQFSHRSRSKSMDGNRIHEAHSDSYRSGRDMKPPPSFRSSPSPRRISPYNSTCRYKRGLENRGPIIREDPMDENKLKRARASDRPEKTTIDSFVPVEEDECAVDYDED